VAPTKLSEIIVANKDDVPIDVLLQYIEDNKNLSGLCRTAKYFLVGGLTQMNNLLYMDNTIILPNLEEALYYADAAEQIAIFDLKHI
jgi:tRNA G18 (ribose-2'-O)-methylase SpoU